MSAYRELLERLLPARRFGVVLGVARMRALLDKLGAPDQRMGTVVHVGGTNGKGSTVAMLAALVGTQGRVAAYTSPHLSCLRERIAFDGVPISEAALVEAATQVQLAGGDELTFFEQLTAIACVAIAAVGPVVTVLEVGLGGRLDATTAIAAPIAVVTGVAMDHEAILGTTLSAIAAEKAGIFKPQQRVVIGAAGEADAVPLLVTAATIAGASAITVVDAAAIAAVPPVALGGAHQRANAAAALAALDHLEACGVILVPADVRAAALASVKHPGRFEELPEGVILDGAHNPHGAAALAAALLARGIRPVCILAVSADKDFTGIIRALAPAMERFIATRYQQERALPPAVLADVINEETDLPATTAPDLTEAIALARTRDVPIVICGSLFLVGEARTLLLHAPTDPFVVTDPKP